MRSITFNKYEKRILTVDGSGKQSTAVCLFCNVTEIPIEDWNKRCSSCKEKQKKLDKKEIIDAGIGKRQPAAIIETEAKQKIFVDKFGRETDNPGYDIVNDPRGWKFTGNLPPSKEIIK